MGVVKFTFLDRKRQQRMLRDRTLFRGGGGLVQIGGRSIIFMQEKGRGWPHKFMHAYKGALLYIGG